MRIIATILSLCIAAGNLGATELEGIRSYCLDFNWAKKGGFSKPGDFAGVNPEAFVEWHKRMNCNVIQTFCVSTNGYAWYRSDVVPAQPKLKRDFLLEHRKYFQAWVKWLPIFIENMDELDPEVLGQSPSESSSSLSA